MKIALCVAMVVLLLQLFSGDSTAQGVGKNQPTKLAAMEGIYKTQSRAPLTVIGWVDTKNETVRGLQIPGLLSFLTYRNIETPVQGLNETPKADRPNVQAVFQTYHTMVMMWGFMFVLTCAGLILWKRKRLEKSPWLLKGLMVSIAFPMIANEVGWVTAEMGRQPWVVYGLLRTVDGVSKSISAGQVLTSIIMFLVIYVFLFALFLFLLDKKIKEGPESHAEGDSVYRDQL